MLTIGEPIDKPFLQCYNNSCRKGQAVLSERHGALAQLARALHWQCRGQGFESPMLHHQRAQILIQCLSPCFCIYSASTLHYCTKQARYNPQCGVNLQVPAFCLQADKTVHPSQSLPKSVRLLKMPFLAPICTPLSNSEHCVRVVTLLRTELIVTEYKNGGMPIKTGARHSFSFRCPGYNQM